MRHPRHFRIFFLFIGPGLFLAPARAEPVPTGSVAGQVIVKSRAGARPDGAGAVVYLDRVPGSFSAPAAHAQMRQRYQDFTPPLLAVLRGTTVDFPNDDKVFHNVFSVSETATFDLGLHKQGAPQSARLDRAGVVEVYCNIHPEMEGTIRVLDNPYFAVTAPGGEFRIDRVPPGTYPIRAWLPHAQEAHGTVTVSAGATARAQLEIAVPVAGQVRRHLRKDGTPYGRYQ